MSYLSRAFIYGNLKESFTDFNLTLSHIDPGAKLIHKNAYTLEPNYELYLGQYSPSVEEAVMVHNPHMCGQVKGELWSFSNLNLFAKHYFLPDKFERAKIRVEYYSIPQKSVQSFTCHTFISKNNTVPKIKNQVILLKNGVYSPKNPIAC